MATRGPKGKRKADTTQDDIRRALTLEKSLFGEDDHVFGGAEVNATVVLESSILPHR